MDCYVKRLSDIWETIASTTDENHSEVIRLPLNSVLLQKKLLDTRHTLTSFSAIIDFNAKEICIVMENDGLNEGLMIEDDLKKVISNKSIYLNNDWLNTIIPLCVADLEVRDWENTFKKPAV